MDDTTFTTGAKRSEIKPFYAAIPFASLRRLALRATGAPRGMVHNDRGSMFVYEGGSLKYGYRNWMEGLPMEDTFNHLIEHLYRWKAQVEAGNNPVDDDLSAVAWGVLLPLMTFEQDYVNQYRIRNEFIKAGVDTGTPEQIDAFMEQTFDRVLIQGLAPCTPKTSPPPNA